MNTPYPRTNKWLLNWSAACHREATQLRAQTLINEHLQKRRKKQQSLRLRRSTWTTIVITSIRFNGAVLQFFRSSFYSSQEVGENHVRHKISHVQNAGRENIARRAGRHTEQPSEIRDSELISDDSLGMKQDVVCSGMGWEDGPVKSSTLGARITCSTKEILLRQR